MYAPRNLQQMTETQLVNQDILRSSAIDSFPNSLIALPKTRRIINPSLIEENSKTDGIQGVIKLKKRIIPNSLLYSQQNDSIFIQVDPRKQRGNWNGTSNENDLTSIIPAGYRYQEMKLNHFGFYDIDYEKYNKF